MEIVIRTRLMEVGKKSNRFVKVHKLCFDLINKIGMGLNAVVSEVAILSEAAGGDSH